MEPEEPPPPRKFRQGNIFYIPTREYFFNNEKCYNLGHSLYFLRTLVGGAHATLGLENGVLVLASHSLSDRRWSISIGQPMRHLLSKMFQQHINSATRINSSTTDVRILG